MSCIFCIFPLQVLDKSDSEVLGVWVFVELYILELFSLESLLSYTVATYINVRYTMYIIVLVKFNPMSTSDLYPLYTLNRYKCRKLSLAYKLKDRIEKPILIPIKNNKICNEYVTQYQLEPGDNIWK